MRTRRTLLLCALALVAAGGAFAAGTAQAHPAVQSLYSRIVADRGVSVETGAAYGPLARQVLDIYRPANGKGDGDDDGPIAVFIYGGGWRSGERGTYGFVGAALAARGITTVIPDYRLYPDVMFPAFIEDAARAYAWTTANLARERRQEATDRARRALGGRAHCGAAGARCPPPRRCRGWQRG